MPTALTNQGVEFPDGSVQTAGLPVGVIAFWSGSVETIPSNWALCDGNNGTPNLSDRFVLCAGGIYTVAATGGSANANVAVHTHSSPFVAAQDGLHRHIFNTTHNHTIPAASRSAPNGSHNHNDSEMYITYPEGAHDHIVAGTSPIEGDHLHAGYTPYAGGHIHDQIGSPSMEDDFVIDTEPGFIGTTAFQNNPAAPVGPITNHFHEFSEEYYAVDTPAPSDYGPNVPAIIGRIPGDDSPTTTYGNGIFGKHPHPAVIEDSWVDHIHPEVLISPDGDHNHIISMSLYPNGQHDHGQYYPGTANPSGDHNHQIIIDGPGSDMDMDDAGAHTHFISSITVVEPTSPVENANLPPYYALAYIMKIT